MPKQTAGEAIHTITRPPRNLFEHYEQAAARRALLARILQDTEDVVNSYENLPLVSAETGIKLEDLEEMANQSLIELTLMYEELMGGVE